MTDFVLGGVTFHAPPLKPFSKLRKAAPLIDKVNEVINAGMTGFVGQVALTEAVVAVFSEAMADTPAPLTQEAIDAMDFSEQEALIEAYLALLGESGLRRGEEVAAADPTQP